jgi:hypothetical protein
MSADKGIALLSTLLGQGLDIFKPRHHGFVSLGPENPSVATVHGSSLTAFDNELVGGTSGLGTRTKLLVWQIQGHDRRLSVDAIGGFELVDMRRRQNIPTKR